jgi:hypothetical protein
MVAQTQKLIFMNNFLKTGVYRNCIIPVTTEDPSLIIHETNPESKRWGILFFIGSATKENCIAVINNETDFGLLHKSILTAPVTRRDGSLKDSVANRINVEFQACVV